MESDGSIHHGHRERLRHRIEKEGLQSLDDRAILELLLFYALPYKDVHPLSFRLMERFGGFVGVLNASAEELSQVEGLSEYGATFLRMIPEICRFYLEKLNEPTERYDNISKLGRLFSDKFLGVRQEQVYLCLLDNSFRILSARVIYVGSINGARITIRRLVENAVDVNASMALIVHNHPGGLAIPSKEDIVTTDLLRKSFDSIGVPLLEHLLIGTSAYMPLLYLLEGRRRLIDRSSLIASRVDLAEFYQLKKEDHPLFAAMPEEDDVAVRKVLPTKKVAATPREITDNIEEDDTDTIFDEMVETIHSITEGTEDEL